MSATDPPEPASPPDAVGTPSDVPPAGPAAPRPPGRQGVTLDAVRDASERLFARLAREPSLRELRRELGGGSMTTITRHRSELAAVRLMESGEPERGSTRSVLLEALSAAMTTLAAEAAEAADDEIARGARVADERIAAIEAVRRRAVDASDEADLKRERALGRVEALEARLEDDAASRTWLEQEVRRLLDTEEALRTEARTQTARLTTEVEARTHAEDARARSDAALDAAEARIESEAGAAAARVEALERTIGEGDAMRAALEVRINEASKENETARAALAAREHDLAAAERRAGESDRAREAALARAEKLEGRVDALLERLAAVETDRITLAAIAAALERRDGDPDDPPPPAADD